MIVYVVVTNEVDGLGRIMEIFDTMEKAQAHIDTLYADSPQGELVIETWEVQ